MPNFISEILDEQCDITQSAVYQDRESNFRIDSSPNWSGAEPYFKVFTNESYFVYEPECNMCRISMTKPEYIFPEDDSNRYKLSNEELNKLVLIIPNVWNELIRNHNHEHQWDSNWINIDEHLPI